MEDKRKVYIATTTSRGYVLAETQEEATRFTETHHTYFQEFRVQAQLASSSTTLPQDTSPWFACGLSDEEDAEDRTTAQWLKSLGQATTEPAPSFGEAVRAIRRGKKMTLRKLSAATRFSVSHISDVELGKRLPSEDLRLRICKALDVYPASLPPVRPTRLHDALHPLLDQWESRKGLMTRGEWVEVSRLIEDVRAALVEQEDQ